MDYKQEYKIEDIVSMIEQINFQINYDKELSLTIKQFL